MNYGYQQGPQATPPKRGMPAWAIILMILGGVFVLGIGSCLVCVGVAAKGAADAQHAAASAAAAPAEPTAPPRPKAPPMQVTAKQLYAEYQANEVSADEKYKGQSLVVSGPIHAIEKDAFGNVIVRLGIGDQFGLQSVMGKLDDSQKAKAMSLVKGKPLALSCQGGGMVIGDPVLDDCVLP